MNLILIGLKSICKSEEGFFFFKTDERQTSHLKNILKVKLNQIVKVGVINKGKGEGIIIEQTNEFYTIKLLSAIHLQKSVDKYIPIDVVICIPRPKILNKFLQQLSSVGVKKIIIVFSDYANKSYESSKILKNAEIKYALQLGLEQAMCTQFPQIFIHYSFGSFFMNIQNYIDKNTIKLCAHTEIKKNPTTIEHDILRREHGKILLMIGCERGFSELEIYLIKKLQFRFFNLTERILKCETALLIIIGQLLLLTENISLRPNGCKMRRSSHDATDMNCLSSMSNISHQSACTNYDSHDTLPHKPASKKSLHEDTDENHLAANSEIEERIEHPDENEQISEIRNLLATEAFLPVQLVNKINNFMYSQVKKEIVENDPCNNEKKDVLEKNANDVDALLRSIHTLGDDKGCKENFQNIYLSLLLKKIKYKKKFFLSYGDEKNNVDEDGVFIYRTQRYVSKKKGGAS
ncbi:hypothetical protein, conserved [Plasmodium gonderi]|uniref:16S rRNA (uracil(1498)-N(3))-methyltransferase n=1 Tax=Plasmodium gonderi TaxID=77519 RepID=A0A1Y1JK64_PLAGO|nr:hypothetical protein, conserved [Plasmodium gonderi]GAW81805.1 hypothetical protein, conserved [Plasmodium gonderi]